jgi:hypothetical protein
MLEGNKNMAAIHLIKNDRGLPSIIPIGEQEGSDIYYSGYWLIAEAKAKNLIGENIFFHKRKTEPSFFGGVIKCAVKVDQGMYPGRTIFIFKSDQACIGITTPPDGWAQEKKYT